MFSFSLSVFASNSRYFRRAGFHPLANRCVTQVILLRGCKPTIIFPGQSGAQTCLFWSSFAGNLQLLLSPSGGWRLPRIDLSWPWGSTPLASAWFRHVIKFWPMWDLRKSSRLPWSYKETKRNKKWFSSIANVVGFRTALLVGEQADVLRTAEKKDEKNLGLGWTAKLANPEWSSLKLLLYEIIYLPYCLSHFEFIFSITCNQKHLN